MKTLIMILVLATSVLGQFYASPTGGPNGDGSLSSPWDLTTASQKVTELDGQTLFLRGGTYPGKYNFTLINAAVRSMPFEHAVIDGNYITTLGAGVSPTDLNLTITGSFIWPVAATASINDSEVVLIQQYLGNGVYRVTRGWAGSTPVAHASGVSVRALGSQISANGRNTTFMDFTVQDSYPVRAFTSVGYGGYLRGGIGIHVFGDDLKFINLIVRDNADGFFLSESAENTTLEGNVIFNNGHVSTDRPHGHGIYAQNVCPSIKILRNNVVFNNFALGSKAYGANQGHSECIEFDKEIHFNNGSPGYYIGTPTTNGGGSPNRRYGNLEVGSDVHPSQNILIKDSSLYHQPNTTVELGGMPLGRTPTGGNTNLTVQGNYVSEPFGDLIKIDRWDGVTVTGNTFAFNQVNGGTFLASVKTPTTVNQWDDNDYFAQTAFLNCIGGSFRAPFHFQGLPSNCGSFSTFQNWQQQTGFDTTSRYTEAFPSQNEIRIQPNAHDPGKSYIAVYNWENLSSISVSLDGTGLTNGQPFVVKNIQNLYGPSVASGVYQSGVQVSLPMTDTSVTTPIGHVYTPSSTCPQFCVFMVVPQPAPTAGTALVSGQVVANGGGVKQVRVTLTGSSQTYSAITNPFGYFSFSDVELGTYLLSASKKGYEFEAQTITVNDDVTGVIISGTSNSRKGRR